MLLSEELQGLNVCIDRIEVALDKETVDHRDGVSLWNDGLRLHLSLYCC
jgi:hypothetical protein